MEHEDITNAIRELDKSLGCIRFDTKNELITIQGKTSGIGTFFRSRANSVTFNFKTGKKIQV